MISSLDNLMEDGWKEVAELGFGRTCVIYEKGNKRLLFDWVNEKIITEYLFNKKDDYK